MAEYRSGDLASAEGILAEAARSDAKDAALVGTSSFFRAICLHRLGRADEARKLMAGALASMKPMPADPGNPLAGGASPDYLILWLACKEAQAMILPEGRSALDPSEAPRPGGEKK